MAQLARLLDHHCTAKTVTAMFCRINAADEVFLPVEAERAGGESVGSGRGGGGGGSGGGAASELDYSEFAELLCRICDSKVPPSARCGPFEQTLDAWLGLSLLPVLRNAKVGMNTAAEAIEVDEANPNGMSKQLGGLKGAPRARRPPLGPSHANRM